MADSLVQALTPIKERHIEYEKNPKQVWEILEDGSRKASGRRRRPWRRCAPA